jgi:hypothetical protein
VYADAPAFAQSTRAHAGRPGDAVTGWYDAVLRLRRDSLVPSVVGIAGYFADRAPRPAIAGLPRLRSIQRRQLKASLGWAAGLLDLPAPDWLDTVPD